MISRVGFASAVLALLVPCAASAQVPYSACLDREQHPIPGIVDNTLPYAAEATVQDGRRVILWNQHRFGGFSSTMRLFVYLHECAHHNLNHLYKGESRSIENQADCWAYQLLVDGGMLDGHHLAELTSELRRTTGDAVHLGGAELLASLADCLELRTRAAAWDSALSVITAAAPTGFRDLQGPRIPDTPTEAYETSLGTPGTYDCEILRPPALRCVIFVSRKQKAAERRYETIVRIIGAWLSPDWMATEPAHPPAGLARAYEAQNDQTGALLVLGLTPEARVYFLVKPAPQP
jgi:hypothetical protein